MCCFTSILLKCQWSHQFFKLGRGVPFCLIALVHQSELTFLDLCLFAYRLFSGRMQTECHFEADNSWQHHRRTSSKDCWSGRQRKKTPAGTRQILWQVQQPHYKTGSLLLPAHSNGIIVSFVFRWRSETASAQPRLAAHCTDDACGWRGSLPACRSVCLLRVMRTHSAFWSFSGWRSLTYPFWCLRTRHFHLRWSNFE